MLIDEAIHVPAPGAQHVHYKGGHYAVLAIGRLSEQRDQLMVVYRSIEKDQVWIRPLGMWSERVMLKGLGDHPRFMPASEHRRLLSQGFASE